jgi:hypothetical protein
MLRLLVTANVVPTSPILVTLMMGAIHSYDTSVLTRATRRNIPEDGILQPLEESCVVSLAWVSTPAAECFRFVPDTRNG